MLHFDETGRFILALLRQNAAFRTQVKARDTQASNSENTCARLVDNHESNLKITLENIEKHLYTRYS